jgi:hypothetical protein
MTTSGSIVQRSLTVHVYATCWNEEKMLPYFFRHYDTLFPDISFSMTDLPIIPRTSFLGRSERSSAPDRPT